MPWTWALGSPEALFVAADDAGLVEAGVQAARDTMSPAAVTAAAARARRRDEGIKVSSRGGG
jgi:hypothetical protein